MVRPCDEFKIEAALSQGGHRIRCLRSSRYHKEGTPARRKRRRGTSSLQERRRFASSLLPGAGKPRGPSASSGRTRGSLPSSLRARPELVEGQIALAENVGRIIIACPGVPRRTSSLREG